MDEELLEDNKPVVVECGRVVVESGRVPVKQEPSTSTFIVSPQPTSSSDARADSVGSTSQYVDLEPFYRAMEEVAFEQLEETEGFEMMEECGEFEDEPLTGYHPEVPIEESSGSGRLPESRLKDFGSDAERAFTKEELPEGQTKYSCLVTDCDYNYVPTTKMHKAVVKNLRLHVKRHIIAYEQQRRQGAANMAQQTPTTSETPATNRIKDQPSAGPAEAETTRPSMRASGKRPAPSSRSSTSSSDEGPRERTGPRTDMDKICEKFPSFRRVNSVAVTAGSRYHERKKELRKDPKTAQNPDADPELQTLHAGYALANRRRARFRQLMRQKPTGLAKLLKAGMSLNQIFRKLPRKGSRMSEQEEAELIDPEEEVREANYRKRKYGDPLPPGVPVVKRAKKSGPDGLDDAPKPKKLRSKGPRAETMFMRTWPTYARLTGIYRRHRYRFNRFKSGEYPDETGEELRRCIAEMDLAKRRRAHFRALAWKDPKKLAECVRDGLNVNEIFKRLPLKSGKPVAEDLLDPLEASYSASGSRNGEGSGGSTPLNRFKSETPDADVIDLSSDEDEHQEDEDDGDSSDNGCDSDEEELMPSVSNQPPSAAEGSRAPPSTSRLCRKWKTYARLYKLCEIFEKRFETLKKQFEQNAAKQKPVEDKTELERRRAESELAKRRRAHFRRLIFARPTELADLVKKGVSVNEMFQRLPLPGSENLIEELYDRDEDQRESAWRRNHPDGRPFIKRKEKRLNEQFPIYARLATIFRRYASRYKILKRKLKSLQAEKASAEAIAAQKAKIKATVVEQSLAMRRRDVFKKLTEERAEQLDDLLEQGLGANEIFRHFLDAGDAVVTAKYEDLEDRQETVDHQRLIKQAQLKKKGVPRERVYDTLRQQYAVYGRLESICVVQAKRYARLKADFESQPNLTAQEQDALDQMAASNALAKRRRTHFRRVLAEHRAKVDELLDHKGTSLNVIFKKLSVEGSFTFDEVYDPEEERREEEYQRKSHHYDSRRGPRDKMHKKVKSEVNNCRWPEFRVLKMAARRCTKLYTEFKKKLEEGDCPDDEELQTELESLKSKMALAVRRRDRVDALYLEKADELRSMLDAGKSFNEIFEEVSLPSDTGPTAASDFFDPEEHLRVSREKESRECLDRFAKEERSDGTVLYKCTFAGCTYAFEATGVKELLDIRRPLVGHYRGKHLNAMRRQQRLKVGDQKRKWKRKKKGKKSRRPAPSSPEIPSHALDHDFYCYTPPTDGPVRRSKRSRSAVKRRDAQMPLLEREDQPTASTAPAEGSTSNGAIVEPPPTYIILILPPDEPSTSAVPVEEASFSVQPESEPMSAVTQAGFHLIQSCFDYTA